MGALPVEVLLVVFYVALPILVIVALLRLLRGAIAGGVRAGLRDADAQDDPLVLLQRRYARGEIDDAEYKHRRDVIAGK